MDTTQTQPHQIANTQWTENKMTDVVIQQHSRKLLMMDILVLTSEASWVHKKWNKIASDIKLVFYFSTMSLFVCYITGSHQNFHVGSTWHSLNIKRTCGHNVNVWLFIIICGESNTKRHGNLSNWTLFFGVEHGRQGDWQTGLFFSTLWFS